MTELLDYVVSKKHHAFRKSPDEFSGLAEKFKAEGLSPIERMTRRFEILSAAETPVLLPDEKICFMRTITKLPDCFTKDEWKDLRAKYHIHEIGYISNLSPNYEDAIRDGLLAKKESADEYGKRIIDAILALTARYRDEALKQSKNDIAEVLERVPAYGARNFREALQSFRIIHYALWLEGDYHNTVGRFDKYMYPYFKADMDAGVYTDESVLDLICDFFISFNKDSDLYNGIQQGDNGQSLVLGGIDEDGNEVYSRLSELCLTASKKLLLIDPKINLRVNKNTPIEVYEFASELTKAGLGFPQYSNDDVVIDALVKHGYDLRDARDYVMAACWEFIIPKCGADVNNIGDLSFPGVVDTVLREKFMDCDTFEDFMTCVEKEIFKQCDILTSKVDNLWFVPSPFMNILIDGGIYNGAKYNNFGFHGCGVATATDSLAVIKKYVYDEKSISKETLLEAVDSDFENHSELLPMLRYEAPKMGNDIDWVDDISVRILKMFSNGLKGRKNCRGGVYRAGTGTAMNYLRHAAKIGASPDGRRKGEPLGTNFSPSLFAKLDGPFSIIKSFSKQDFSSAINGGPLTLEFASSMFADEDSVKKVGALVKAYIDMGGHQLQLNAVNTERMLDAKKNPDKHRQLVVRIWGWSAYFVELDEEYQNHVLLRQQYQM